MNSIPARSTSNSILGTGIRVIRAGALFACFLGLSATYVLSGMAPTQHGGSVHAKNAATPDWIVERQTQNAHQMPVVIDTDEPSFWI